MFAEKSVNSSTYKPQDEPAALGVCATNEPQDEEPFKIVDPFACLTDEPQDKPAALGVCATNEPQKKQISLKKSSTNELLKESQKVNKGKQIHFRLSDEEYNTVIAQMGLAEYTNVSQYCRACATKKRLKKTNKLSIEKQTEMIKLMRNLANNVNQIAKHANQTHEVENLDEIRKEMKKLWQLVQ